MPRVEVSSNVVAAAIHPAPGEALPRPKGLAFPLPSWEKPFAMKIYTRTGDDGSTSLLAGGRVSKADLRIAVCGTLDELNCAVGVARAASPTSATDCALATIQRRLFEFGADLAGPASPANRLEPSVISWMESEIDRLSAELPVLKNFILPGGHGPAAQIHFARAVCRRAEREIVRLAQNEHVAASGLVFLNRLSDFLFVLARYENFLRGCSEEKWNE